MNPHTALPLLSFVLTYKKIPPQENWRLTNKGSTVTIQFDRGFIIIKKMPALTIVTSIKKQQLRMVINKNQVIFSLFFLNNRVHVSTDDGANLPLFYYCSNKSLYASATLPGLLVLIPNKQLPEINKQEIVRYVAGVHNPFKQTILKRVFVLGENQLLIFDGKVHLSQKYPNEELVDKNSIKRSIKKNGAEFLRSLLSKSIESIAGKKLPFGVSVSCGIDSGVVAHAFQKNLLNKRVFSIILPKHDPQHGGQEKKLNALASIIKSPIRGFSSENIDPFRHLYGNDYGLFNPYQEVYSSLTSKFAQHLHSQHIAVVLNGFGGDEIFALKKRLLLGKSFPRGLFTKKALGLMSSQTATKKTLSYIPHSVRCSNLVYNHLFHNYNMWVSSPLCAKSIISYTLSLPNIMLKNKSFLFAYAKHFGFPVLLQKTPSEDFTFIHQYWGSKLLKTTFAQDSFDFLYSKLKMSALMTKKFYSFIDQNRVSKIFDIRIYNMIACVKFVRLYFNYKYGR